MVVSARETYLGKASSVRFLRWERNTGAEYRRYGTCNTCRIYGRSTWIFSAFVVHMQSGVARVTLELELVMIEPDRFQHYVNMMDFASGSLIS